MVPLNSDFDKFRRFLADMEIEVEYKAMYACYDGSLRPVPGYEKFVKGAEKAAFFLSVAVIIAGAALLPPAVFVASAGTGAANGMFAGAALGSVVGPKPKPTPQCKVIEMTFTNVGNRRCNWAELVLLKWALTNKWEVRSDSLINPANMEAALRNPKPPTPWKRQDKGKKTSSRKSSKSRTQSTGKSIAKWLIDN